MPTSPVKESLVKGIPGGGMVGRGVNVESGMWNGRGSGMRRKIGICRIIFHPTASLCFYNILIINVLSKLPLRLGALESTQSQSIFL